MSNPATPPSKEGAPVSATLPRDPNRFAQLSPEPPAKLPPGFGLPSAEELARMTLQRLLGIYRKPPSGN